MFSVLPGQTQFGAQIMRQPLVKAKQNQSDFNIMKTAVPNNPSETNIPPGPKTQMDTSKLLPKSPDTKTTFAAAVDLP